MILELHDRRQQKTNDPPQSAPPGDGLTTGATVQQPAGVGLNTNAMARTQRLSTTDAKAKTFFARGRTADGAEADRLTEASTTAGNAVRDVIRFQTAGRSDAMIDFSEFENFFVTLPWVMPHLPMVFGTNRFHCRLVLDSGYQSFEKSTRWHHDQACWKNSQQKTIENIAAIPPLTDRATQNANRMALRQTSILLCFQGFMICRFPAFSSSTLTPE